ncbi:MAG: ThuA domain-containing protein [Capsulimonadales bacterium]|nr:ThuA domain-containing protein [Capsulimonadales bacterium]
MAERNALIVWGGWDGHQPKEVAEIFRETLTRHGFDVTVSDTLDAYLEEDLQKYHLIVPVWTMGTISGEQERNLLNAVRSGVGIGGCHGGMCDSFRNNTEYQWMTGGQWVAHPGNDGVEYTVEIRDPDHFITQGVPPVFTVRSEQYYLHVDPAVRVLATTRFPVADGPHRKNGPVDMPTVWTKYWGEGRVFYNALGHQANIVAQPEVLALCTRGLLWAAGAEDAI